MRNQDIKVNLHMVTQWLVAIDFGRGAFRTGFFFFFFLPSVGLQQLCVFTFCTPHWQLSSIPCHTDTLSDALGANYYGYRYA
ncbi:hypothetical protein FKM82_009273 [Ascaphus truei]